MQRKLLLFFLTFASLQGFSQLTVVRLKCESKEAPLGIESTAPRLSWQIRSSSRNVLQTACRVLVADDLSSLKKNTGNVWDSKKVLSDASIQIKFNGKKLSPAKTYYWKVMVWDNGGHASAWSKVSNWQTGLPAKEDWKGAQWIAYDKIPDSLITVLPTDGKKDKYIGNNVLPLLRKRFVVKKPLKKATLFICGLGQFEASINGKKIGDHFLDPGWTKYDKQALYVPFDVTKNLQSGGNAIGVMLGNGFYYIPPVTGRYRKLKGAFGFPKMICRLALEYNDGTTESVVSDASWKTTKSPVTFSSIYGGEDYDAQLEQKGWDSYSFNDAAWKPVLLLEGPQVLNAQMAEPLKVMQTFLPRKVSSKGNDWVFDLGQNASGIPQITVQGKRGDTIRIYPAELLKEDGTINQRPTGSPYYLTYILKGDGAETWQPRFTYYGYRYLQVAGAVPKGQKSDSTLPVLLQIKGLHTRNSADKVGSFACSSDLFNRTYSLVDWSVKSNMASLFTDCPHREKLGWLEQDHLMGNSIRYTYDAVNLFRKQLHDIRYSQLADGLVPETAPEYLKFEWGGDMFRDSPEWGSTSIILPWYLYQWYGDRDVLEENYDVMKKYSAYLQTKAKGYVLSQGLGDWYDLGPNPPGVSQLTPMGVTGTAIYYYDLNILSKIANLLGEQEDAKSFDALAVNVKKAFNDSFFHADTKQYATGSQTANAMAVYMNLVEPQYKQAVIDNIVKDIRSRNNALTAGDIGYRYLLCVLHEAGRDDVIYDMNSRSDVPGYGYQLAKGATALTESWAALSRVSNNHLMLGHIMEWFYRGLAGIEQDNRAIAFKKIIINPQIVGDVTSAKGSFESPYGRVVSDWKKDGDNFRLTVEIPANTTAVVYLPAADASKIKEGKAAVLSHKNIQPLGTEGGKIKLAIGSGVYRFTVTNKSANDFASK
ncbi:family 78 glycoside hydrolase catalytic domain [Flavisolibacter ginsenosidimutans]|uniref:alpha-L-rhamnosidase n=1 Tax=Flavisolibacter ginsenosidimutans TaxID=661481 RepID=A0A5B8UGP9_9BACT|nr:family 78 glycoside hydrolase catalytic domain [Flavisolibacter ginsenosidimutans]QEC55688.1 Bacterial alpha-L-rhamnosidase [Flavisolibacter ginsenosidimutans]